MATLNDLNLSRNPFDTTPIPGEKIVWAGMPIVKEKIEALYRELKNSNSKKVVLNWGPFGGGKTHAAEYFSRNISNVKSSPKITHIVCNLPFDAKDSSKAFLRRIIDNLTVDYIRQELAFAIQTLGKENLISFLVSRTRSDIFPDTIVRLFELPSNEIIRRYIHEGLTSNDLKKVHLAKSLKSDEDFFNFGIALLSMLTACSDRRVVMWIDEMENMLYYQNKQYRTFGMMIREMSDKVAERLMIFLNFTLTEDDSDTIDLLR